MTERRAKSYVRETSGIVRGTNDPANKIGKSRGYINMGPIEYLTLLDQATTDFDSHYNAKLAKARCPCCTQCWVYLNGPKGPKRDANGNQYVECTNGGPYNGYYK